MELSIREVGRRSHGDYTGFMRSFLTVVLIVDMLAVAAVMLTGALGMANPNRSPQLSNRLMRWRVILQAVAIGLVMLLMLT